MNATRAIFFLFCFFFSSSYLVFLNSKVVESTNKVQEFKLFTDLVNRCLVTVPTRYPIPFSTADYWTNYEFHNKVKMCLWTVSVKEADDLLAGICSVFLQVQHQCVNTRARKRRKCLSVVVFWAENCLYLFQMKDCNAKENFMVW